MKSLRLLILSKWLFKRGTHTLRGSGPFDPGLAVSLFQDAAEMMLAAVAEEVDAKVTKNLIGFFDWWDLIARAPGKGDRDLPPKINLRQLNDARISFKHFGRSPPRDEALAHQATCEQFLIQTTATFFEREFLELSLASLIPGSLGELLVEAESLLDSGDIRAALEKCADVQAGIDKLQEPITRVPISISFPPGTPHAVKKYVDDNVSDLRQSIIKAVQIALSGHFGVNPIQYAVMRDHLPTGHGSAYSFKRSPDAITATEVRAWIDLQINYLLALQDAIAFLSAR